MVAVFILIAIVVVAIAVVVANTSREELNRAWNKVALEHDIAFTPATWSVKPRLEGNVEGFPLRVDIQTKGSGKHQSPHTRFRLGLPSLDLGLDIKEEGFFSAFSKVFSPGDIELGDARFDDRLLVRGKDPDAVRQFLDPGRRSLVLNFFDSHRGATIDDREILWSKQGRLSSTSLLLATIEELLVVGRALTDERPLEAPASAVAASPEPEPRVPIDPAPLAEVDAAADPASAATEEIAASPDAASEPEAAPEPAVTSSAEPISVEPAVDIVAFCDSVFAPGAMSFEANKAFDEAYKGRQVTWIGTLKTAEPYSFDFVFGSGRGVRATLAIHTVDAGLIGNKDVDAVIQLPATTAGLAARVGERLPFSGTLTKVDGLSRKVFVTDASLGA